MKIIFHCQHIWGVGHFFRALEICRALKEHELILVTGGAHLERGLPDHVRHFCLPGLMTDRNYQGLHPTDPDRSLEDVCQERKELLGALFTKECPDVFLVELYPFGRKAFRFELDPILKDIRSGRLRCGKVICSLRDILVEKPDPAVYESRVVNQLNLYFDALLVHADPALVTLDLTFSRVQDIDIPVVYTGYIASEPSPHPGNELRKELNIDPEEHLVVASTGGGKVGIVMLEPLLEGFPRLASGTPIHLHAFTGPYMPEKEFSFLSSHAGPRVKVRRFTSRFLAYLGAADLSVSMGGYNTIMNILSTGVPALVWPYPGDQEQGLRASRLAELGVLDVIAERDLKPERLAALVRGKLGFSIRRSHSIDLSGAVNTARWMSACAED
ncbi:MAG: glycosyl transferase [Deltaproteobacteria bacterium]|nr:glycosyl transferase [Deltaproteobacteria bacterium]